MALPPRGNAAEGEGSDPGRSGPKGMVMVMFWNGGGWPFGEVALMWVGMIAFWGLLIWVIYALVMAATRKPDHGDHGDHGRDPQAGSAVGTGGGR